MKKEEKKRNLWNVLSKDEQKKILGQGFTNDCYLECGPSGGRRVTWYLCICY